MESSLDLTNKLMTSPAWPACPNNLLLLRRQTAALQCYESPVDRNMACWMANDYYTWIYVYDL